MVSFFSCIDFLFVCSLCRKKLGIASAGAAGLKEFTQSLNGWEVPRKFLFPARNAPSVLFLFPARNVPSVLFLFPARNVPSRSRYILTI